MQFISFVYQFTIRNIQINYVIFSVIIVEFFFLIQEQKILSFETQMINTHSFKSIKTLWKKTELNINI
jgi:hypothetical protein